MKAHTLCFLFILLYFVKSVVQCSLVSSAICSVLAQNADKFFKVDIILYQTDSSSKVLGDVIRKTLDLFSSKVINVASSAVQLNGSSVLLFDSAETFRRNAKTIRWLTHPALRYRHIVYAPNLTTNDVTENIEDGFDIDQVAFLMNETKKSIDLVSSFMFTPEKRRTNQLRVVNRFNGTSKHWTNREFFPEKYRNFHNCELTFVFDESSPSFLPVQSLYETISGNLNFTLTTVKLKDVIQSFDSQDLYDSLIRIMLINIYPISVTVFEYKYIWLVPDGEPVALLDKMFMMFDLEVWLAIGCFLLFWFLSIQIINRTAKVVRNFVFGRLVKTPTMNMFSIFLHGTQHIVPGRNFARFLLILFLYWSLIFRTCYQSMLFQFLQLDVREPRIATWAEMFAKNWTVWNLFPEGFSGMNGNIVNCTVYTLPCSEKTSDPANKAIFLTSDTHLNIIRSSYRSGHPSIFPMKDIFFNLPMGLGFKPFSPLFETFNEKIGQLLANGFVCKLNKQLPSGKIKSSDDIGPQVLTLDHLGLGFIACLIPLALATIVFSMELAVNAAKHLKLKETICQ